ncbi:flagellar protein FlgN [Massilia sp. PAMC28688]|uniref:flagella synthesis protein FlgN n=1 Tax=Massilia sp. PAMC28688 TaxID=2861283 RepID=UPI001C628E47|nr:flagellar protein FlgN [Massilia sp. PAMC28688]QYF92006.1 flagellar protein FlgN [Massilia sp. PAMC28688]
MATSPHTTLHDELALIDALIDLMKQEQQCLVAADTDTLASLTPVKTAHISQLALLAGQRHAALAGAGLPGSEAGMDSWLAAKNEPAMQAVWQEALARMREAKELNRVNGMLINKQMTHNQNLITAMRTPADAADMGVYGPKGQTSSANNKRPLVVG